MIRLRVKHNGGGDNTLLLILAQQLEKMNATIIARTDDAAASMTDLLIAYEGTNYADIIGITAELFCHNFVGHSMAAPAEQLIIKGTSAIAYKLSL